MRRKMIRTICVLTMCMMVFTLMPVKASAASDRTVTRSYDVLKADSAIKGLNVYGRDVFRIVYNPNSKTISRCSVGQQSKNLGTNICEPYRIVMTKNTKKEKKYTSTWYINFNYLPKAKLGGKKADTYVKKAMGQFAPAVVKFSDMGRIMKVTTKYTVKGNGQLIRNGSAVKFMVPSRCTNEIKKVQSLFVKKYGMGGR